MQDVAADECVKSLSLQQLSGDYWNNGKCKRGVTLSRTGNDDPDIVLTGLVRSTTG